MISQILQHLDSLQVELSAIDPTQDFEAADKVARIAAALRHIATKRQEPAVGTNPAERTVPARHAA